MATTTDFNEWLANLDTEDGIETINNLYDSITSTMLNGEFDTTEKDGKKFVKTNLNENTLLLATSEAEKAFLNILDYKHGGDYGSVKSQYDFTRNMNKD